MKIFTLLKKGFSSEPLHNRELSCVDHVGGSDWSGHEGQAAHLGTLGGTGHKQALAGGEAAQHTQILIK